MSRIPRWKVQAKFAKRTEESSAFAQMIENTVEMQETIARYEAEKSGINYDTLSEGRKREYLCDMLR
jgi:hypothetical protein